MAKIDAQLGIELDRGFLDIPAVSGEVDPEALVSAALAFGKTKTWPEILEHRYVVVLGEAGTGKTTEFRRRAALANGDVDGFFVELTALANSGLRECLLLDVKHRFDDWQASNREACLFLDSLDEAKLQRRTLREALLKLQGALESQWNRVRMVISCRASDWRESDQATVEAAVPADRRTDIRIVQIAPLRTEQVARLAEHVGVRDVDGFVRAVAAGYAQAFVERPLDVAWLGAYWNKHGRLGSFRELIAENIDEKLNERSPDRSTTLSLEKKREGARAIAGIATLSRRLSIALPGDSIDVDRSESAIDTSEVFADWPSPEILELLRTGLFDESTYSRVRLHHRSVQDYLTAAWLHELRQAGLALERVRDFFLREESGERVVPQHLASVVAWLCLWDAGLRADMIKEAPALLIAYGDPGGFTEADRVEILRAYGASYTGRNRRFDDFEVASLERFASPALADALATLLNQQDLPDELAAMLFQIVELGQIEACMPHAMKSALDVHQFGRGRNAAIRAVAAIGSIEQRRSLLELLDTTAVWPQDVAGTFVRATYPDLLDVDGLMRVISKAAAKPQNLTTSLQVVLEFEVPKSGDLEQRLRVLDGILKLIGTTSGLEPLAIDPGRDWILRSLANVLGLVLDEIPKWSEQPEPVMIALDVFRRCNEQGLHIWFGVDEVREVVARHPEVRRKLFWQRVNEHQAATGRVPRSRHEMRYRHDLFDLTTEDVAWLARDAQSRQDVRERLLAFDVLVWIPRTSEEREQHLDLLRTVAKPDPALTKRLERLLCRTSLVRPAEAKFVRLQEARKLRIERSREKHRAELRDVIGSIRNGSNLNALCFLLRTAQQHGSTHSWGSASAKPVRAIYGDEIADAAEHGWRAYWRTYEPPLPHERNANSVPWGVVVGLVGITSEFESQADYANLEPSLVTKATRYAANEMNRFPGWLGPLAELYPQLVGQALEPAIAADYRTAGSAHDVLSKLPRAEDSVRIACAPLILGLVKEGDPPTVIALIEALGTLLSVPRLDLMDLDALVGDRCRSAIGERRRFGAWWTTWINRDSNAALDFLDEQLAEQPRKTAYDLVEEICDRIHEGIPAAPTPLRSDVAALTRLVPIVYDFIRFEDDIDHEGTFSPGPRDNAQEVRGSLVSWLAGIPGSESVSALRRIADDPRVAAVREWILHKADTRAITDAGSQTPELEASLVALYRKHGIQARSHVFELGEGPQTMKILFLASNPACTERLELGEEAREIQQKLRASELRDAILFRPRWAVQPADLQQVLLEEEPTVVHFSGHGDEADGLVFHNETLGEDHLVAADVLCRLFQVLKGRIRVVVLNACYSEAQAKAIAKTIDCVIGMSDSIGDQAAIKFAAAFYRGLGFGKSVQAAFELGKSEMELTGHARESSTPVLHFREGIDPSRTILVSRVARE